MNLSNLRILSVEDHEDTARLLSFLLTNSGYEVHTAGTIGEGLRFARSGDYSLFLLDNRLPDGTGVELCREIRLFNLHTPIVFYSSDYGSVVRPQALKAGAQAFVKKGADFDVLRETISRLTKNTAEGRNRDI